MVTNLFFEDGIAYRKRSSKKSAKTLIFLHGIGANSTVWSEYEEFFSKNYNVISMDLRGHGFSKRLHKKDDYAFSQFSKDLYKVLKKEKINKCTVVGYSFSNYILLEFIKKYPHMVDSLIFISFHSSPGKVYKSKSLRFLLKILGKIAPAGKRHLAPQDYRNYILNRESDLKTLLRSIDNMGLRQYAHMAEHTLDYEGDPIMNQIRTPTLLIHGRGDKVFPISEAKAVVKKVETSTLIEIKKGSHRLVLENSKEIMRKMAKYLKEVLS
ncbi:2-succinyl-6-hydroxy-2,4-cyclohexadiene-1-carboxylate synthase [uncultured archaeon]|nr:2-succinyl-6-hydroxy-2,4-cyclohexadiene-1-carboxylate synthase [uncultured archaeon]